MPGIVGSRSSLLPAITFLIVTFAFMPKALLGLGVFGPFDILEYASPWRDALASAPHVSTAVQNDAVQGIPVLQAIISALRHGHWLTWSPYVAGGEPVGAVVTSDAQSPFNLLMVVLPAIWGMAAATALQLLFSQTFFYLFLRRLRLSAPVATFGAVAYTFCGTNVALLDRINADLILPGMLWATTRLLQRRRPGDVVWLAVMTALAWLEGFPGGFVNVVVIDVLAALVLCLGFVEGGDPRRLTRQALTGMALVGCGLALAAGLVAFSVLPTDRVLTESGVLTARHYNSQQHLADVLLPEMFSVGALGNLHQAVLMPTLEPGGAISGAGNAVELEGGAGLVVVVAALASLVLAVIGRLRLSRPQRALYVFGVIATVGGLALVYFDTPLLSLFYDLPLLGNSPANRFRIVANLGLVLLACLGLDGLRGRREATAGLSSPTSTAARADQRSIPLMVASALGLLALADMARLVWPGYSGWLHNPLAHNVARELPLEGVGAVLVVSAVLVIAAAPKRLARHSARLWAGAGVVLALATFGTTGFAIRYFDPTVAKSLYLPVTSGHRTLRRLVGDNYRVFGSGLGTFYSDTSIHYRYLDLRGLSFADPSFRALVRAAIPNAYALDQFKIIYDPAVGGPINFASPVLDDLGVRYYIGGTNEIPFARAIPAKSPTATRHISTGRPATGPLHAAPGLTGLGVPLERVGNCDRTRVEVTVANSSGRRIAQASRPAIDAPDGTVGVLPFVIPAAAAATGGSLEVSIALTGPGCDVAVGVRGGRLALSQLVRRPGDLPVVANNQAIFYQRAHAHPIAWVAGTWRPANSALQALDWATAAARRWNDPVPVSGAGAPQTGAGGSVKSIHYVSDGFDVAARTHGSALIATGFSGDTRNWTVNVDGHQARVALVDGALLGVRVSPGAHEVEFRYHVPGLTEGALISALAVLIAVSLVVAERRRSPGSRGQAGSDPASDSDSVTEPP